MRNLCRIFLVIALFGSLGTRSSRAGGIVVGNLDQPPDTVDAPLQITPYLSQFNSPGLTAAQQFTTGPGSSTITDILASLGNLDLGTSKGFELTAGLYSDNTSQGNSIPGTLLTSFTFNLAAIPTSGFANIDFATSAITLTADSNYWFVLGADQYHCAARRFVRWQRYLAVHPVHQRLRAGPTASL